MKVLPEQNVTIRLFECEYCGKQAGQKKLTNHEQYCYFNPNRICGDHGCNETGKNEDGSDCERCKIAEKCGGKSYISR